MVKIKEARRCARRRPQPLKVEGLQPGFYPQRAPAWPAPGKPARKQRRGERGFHETGNQAPGAETAILKRQKPRFRVQLCASAIFLPLLPKGGEGRGEEAYYFSSSNPLALHPPQYCYGGRAALPPARAGRGSRWLCQVALRNSGCATNAFHLHELSFIIAGAESNETFKISWPNYFSDSIPAPKA